MKTDIKAEVRAALLANADLITLLGGQRVYQLAGPNAEEYPRLTFFEIDNVDSHYADDVAYAADVYIQIDVWSLGSTSAISGEVDETMKLEGWTRTSAGDYFENETRVYHKALRYRNTIPE